MKRLAIPLAAAVVTTLAACQASTVGAEKSAGEPAPPGTGAAPALTDTERAAAEVAVDALAAKLAIPKDRIEVVTVQAEDWRDSSLGCPQPDRAYLQVITPGHRITLTADGQTYAVHEAGNHAFVCMQAKPAAGSAPAGRDLGFSRQFVLARGDLAGRLNVPEGEIRLSGAEPFTWEDAALGCPEPGAQYAQVETRGWILKLRHGTRDYTYHADAGRAIPCPGITAQ